MEKSEIIKSLPQLTGKKIIKICYSEKNSLFSQSGNLYLEFEDGNHFEIYAAAEMHFTGTIQYDPDLGSIAERTFTMAKTSTLLAAKVEGACVWFSDDTSKE